MPRATRSRKPLADAEPVPAPESPVKITKTKKKSAAAPLKPSTRSTNPPKVTTEPTKPPTKSTRTRSAATTNPTPSSSDSPSELPPAPPPQKKTRAKVPKRSLAPRPVAASTPSTRSTRRTATESTVKNSSPKPALETETIQEAPSTPTKPTALPSPIEEEAPKEVSISPAQSSNAENRTPASAPPSSPPLHLPLHQSTPKTTRPTGLEFSSGAGYTPPPVLNSTERPRLQDLEPRTLLPIDSDSESAPGLPSPTPKRRNTRPAAPVNTYNFTIAGETFSIYSDDNNPRSLPATPSKAAADAEELSGTQAPPMSDTPTPRKRAPSEESDGEATVVESPKPRKTRKVDPKKGQPAVLLTKDLKTLMPARKRAVKKVGKAMYDMSSDEDEDSNSEDELSRPAHRGKGKQVAVAKGKGKEKVAAKPHAAAVKVTKNAWSKPMSRAAPNTYSRRTRQDTQEAEDAEQEEASSELTPPPPSSDATVEIGDGEVNHLGRRKLKEMRQKFQEVDKWEMEFETVSDK